MSQTGLRFVYSSEYHNLSELSQEPFGGIKHYFVPLDWISVEKVNLIIHI